MTFLPTPNHNTGPQSKTNSFTRGGKVKEQSHIRGTLRKTCGYPNWAFIKSNFSKRRNGEENGNKWNNLVISYVSDVLTLLDKKLFI